MNLEAYAYRRGSGHGFEGRVGYKQLLRVDAAVVAAVAVAVRKAWIGREEADSVVRGG